MVSVIVPAYNAEKTIKDCVDSILSQTYSDIEVIIVNDGSSDHTLEKIELLAKEDSRIVVIDQSNKGASAARNTGLQAVRGKYITFVDADDTILPKMIESLLLYQKKYHADLVKSGIKRISFKRKAVRRAVEQGSVIKNYKSKREIRACFFDILADDLNSLVGKLYRRSVIVKNGIRFDESLALSEDLHFNLSYLEYITCAVFTTETFYEYRAYNSQVTTKYRSKLYERRKKSIELMDEFLVRNHLDRNIIGFLYMKLMFSEAMCEIEHGTPRKKRLLLIRNNLARSQIREAIQRDRRQGMMDRLLCFVAGKSKPYMIDVCARFMCLIKKIPFIRIQRVSV